MPRSRINGNFIDKTFSIVANILLRIIPTTSGEKEAFTYYRDGAIWFLVFYFFISYLVISLRLTRKTRQVIEKKIYAYWRWSLELEQFLLSCILDSCNLKCYVSFIDSRIERKVTPRGSTGKSYSISANKQHRGRITTPRNQQHENFVLNYPLLIGLGIERMVGTTSIHLVRTVDTCITIEGCWSD